MDERLKTLAIFGIEYYNVFAGMRMEEKSCLDRTNYC